MPETAQGRRRRNDAPLTSVHVQMLQRELDGFLSFVGLFDLVVRHRRALVYDGQARFLRNSQSQSV